MVLCIEPMINMGTKKVTRKKTVGQSGHMTTNLQHIFELAVAIEKDKADILSTFSYIAEI